MFFIFKKRFDNNSKSERLQKTVVKSLNRCSRRSETITRKDLVNDIFDHCRLTGVAKNKYHKSGDLQFLHTVDSILLDLRKVGTIYSKSRGTYAFTTF